MGYSFGKSFRVRWGIVKLTAYLFSPAISSPSSCLPTSRWQVLSSSVSPFGVTYRNWGVNSFIVIVTSLQSKGIVCYGSMAAKRRTGWAHINQRKSSCWGFRIIGYRWGGHGKGGMALKLREAVRKKKRRGEEGEHAKGPVSSGWLTHDSSTL